MPNLHIVIGDANTRKSSLIRCLTGYGGGAGANEKDIALTNGSVITVYCKPSALQEKAAGGPFDPAAFITFIQNLQQSPTDIIFSLRVSASGGCPQAAAYLSAFTIQPGWQIANMALLGNSAHAVQAILQPLAGNARVVSVRNGRNQPTNLSAQQVRQVWGWA